MTYHIIIKYFIEMEVFLIPDNKNVVQPIRYLSSGEMYVMEQFQRHILDLAIWSRALIIALKFNSPNAEDIYKRLLEEPDDTEQIMATFFGLENAKIFENYLMTLVTNFRHLADALLSNDIQQANESYKNLNQVANDMSEFFYELNPSSSLDQWHQLLHGYVDMLYNEIYTIISGNYTGEIGLFDTIIDQSYLIADYISNTIFSSTHPAPSSAAPPATSPSSRAVPS